MIFIIPQNDKQAVPQDGGGKGGMFSPTAGYAAPDSKINRWSM